MRLDKPLAMPFAGILAVFVVVAAVLSGRIFAIEDVRLYIRAEQQQAPSWSKDDLNFFLHGSMSTEVVPESVLRAFIKTYPIYFQARTSAILG